MQQKYPWLPQDILQRYTHSYGSLTPQLIGDAQSLNDLGKDFGAGLYEKEVVYLIQHEWALTLDDIIWRRTKLGLFLSEDEQKRLAEFIQENCELP